MPSILSAARLGAVLLLLSPAAFAQSEATYRVTFDATWSMATHPAGFPAGAHFSPLVGAAHDAGASLWAPGGIASDGVEAMAERGVTSVLASEIGALRDAGHAGEPLVGPGAGSPDTATMTVTVSSATPLLSLVTMLAPSPDWFVGVHDLDLRAGGAWATALDVPLTVYDAGTDSGTEYTSANADTQPRTAIAQIAGAPFLIGGTVPPVGALRLELLSVTAGEETAEATGFALSVPAPNPTRGASALVLALDAAQAVDVRVLDALSRTVAILATGRHAAGPLALRVETVQLAAGVYAVVARGERAAATRRLVVVR